MTDQNSSQPNSSIGAVLAAKSPEEAHGMAFCEFGHSEFENQEPTSALRCSLCKYNCSTLSRAHGVRRKNFRLDLMLGSWLKQRTGTAALMASQPMVSESRVTIISRVMPSSLDGFADWFIRRRLIGSRKNEKLYTLVQSNAARRQFVVRGDHQRAYNRRHSSRIGNHV